MHTDWPNWVGTWQTFTMARKPTGGHEQHKHTPAQHHVPEADHGLAEYRLIGFPLWYTRPNE